MKIEHITAVIAFTASVVTFDAILGAPWWLTIIGSGAGTFVGWQIGCLIRAFRGDPESDVKITTYKQQQDGTFRKYDSTYRKPPSQRNYEDFGD